MSQTARQVVSQTGQIGKSGVSQTARQVDSETGQTGKNMKSQAVREEDGRAGKMAKRIRTFRDLVAWQRGMELAEAIYHLTAEMPDTERFGLISQMRRAAVSVPSNIAEGHARGSLADYLRFLRTARASLAELSTQLELAARIGLVEVSIQVSDLVNEEARILQALIKSLERTDVR